MNPSHRAMHQPPAISDYHRDVARRSPTGPGPAPLVSVVTVVWNGEQFLEDAIRSVIEQDYPAIEYIVVDGGSTDGTPDILERHRDRVDVLISEPDEGIYDAMNKGIAVSRGQLVKLLNADDRLLPGSVSAAVRAYLGPDRTGPRHDEDPGPEAVVIKSDMEFVDRHGEPLKRIGARRAVNPVGAVLHPSWYVDRRLYEKHGLYDTGFRVSADYEMFVRLHHLGVRFHHCATPLVEFRSGGVSQTMTGVFERYDINKRYFSRRVAARTFTMHAYKKLRARMLLRLLGEQRMYQVRRLIHRALGVRD